MIRPNIDTITATSARNRAAWGKPNTQSAAIIPPAHPLGTGATGRAARTEITLELPYPPSVNHYWRNVTVDRAVLSAEAKAYRIAVLAAVGPRKPLRTRLSVEIELFPPDKRKRDLDNPIKALLDSLQHAYVFDDDEQIDRLTVCRREVFKGGACVVWIGEATTR
jgi:crossover junction endodeoxyribonuclease RusA